MGKPVSFFASQAAEEILESYLKLPKKLCPNDGRTGGYLTILNAETGIVESILLIGKITNGKDKKYLEFSQEKAKRLLEMKGYGFKHTTSWESRDLENNKYGGAIFSQHNYEFASFKVHPDYIFSFSGLPELADEALVVMLRALFLESCWEDDSIDIKDVVGNFYDDKRKSKGKEIFDALSGLFHKPLITKKSADYLINNVLNDAFDNNMKNSISLKMRGKVL